MDRLRDVGEALSEAFGRPVPLDFIEDALGLERRVRLHDVIYRAAEERRRMPHMAFIRSMPRRLSEMIREFLEDEARNTYMAYLIAEELLKKSGRRGS